ncbi:MAG: flagellar hook-associated protein FlgK [Christensenellales bacterium]|jgi:flagellar hook-associated protein 1 FlgK
MSSLFYGLEIARTGLTVSQKAINLSGHNIANANTEGYTRQRLVINSIQPASVNVRLSSISRGSVGGGATVALVDQIRNDYLDRQFRNQNTRLGYWQVKADEMEYIEMVVNELSEDTSISSALADFFKSLSDLAENDPSSKEIRTSVQQNALKMTETFNQYYEQLIELQNLYNDKMAGTVARINTLLTNIADNNRQIFAYELSGEKANELRDTRNLMIDELSKLIDISVTESETGEIIIKCGEEVLVNHLAVTTLEAQPDPENNDFYKICLSGSNDELQFSGGELKAYQDLRDGNSADNLGIPRIIDNLNTLARSIAEEFNKIHSKGYTMPNGTTDSQDGVNLFYVPIAADGSEDYSAITAGNFTLSDEVLESVFNIAASDQKIDFSAGNTQQGNNRIALAMVTLTSRTDLAVVGNFEEFLKSAMVEVGTESASCKSKAESQQTIVENVNDRRQSISGVSLDEEMVQLISSQHAYSAAARMMTAVDEALDVLINRTGRVGL